MQLPVADPKLAVLRREAKGLGFPWPALREVLPDWWTDAVRHASGVSELRMFLIKHLGLELAPDGHLKLQSLPAAKFKTDKGTSADKVGPSRAIATSIARIVGEATLPAWKGASQDPFALRKHILEKINPAWIDFASLVAASWQLGIPVIYIPKLPTSGCKMAGMVTFVSERPVILLTKKNDRPDWMLFILAHELGHIALNHLSAEDGDAIVDERVGEDAQKSDSDIQEHEANQFAARVLAGSDCRLKIGGVLPKADRLASLALREGELRKISPGHLILNCVNHTQINGEKPFSLGNAALALVDAQLCQASTSQICQTFIEKNLDLTRVRTESQEFLEKFNLS